MEDIDKIIEFAKHKISTSVSSHIGAYETIIKYCELLKGDEEHTKPLSKNCNYSNSDECDCTGKYCGNNT